MLLLTSTSDIIRIVTSSTAGIDVHASWVDYSAGTVTPGRTNTKITTATTTTIVAAPAASTQRNAKTLHIGNIHATTSNVVSVEHFDGTNSILLESVTLLAGERLAYKEGQGFELIDANGITKTNPAAAVFVSRLTSDLANSTTTAAKVTALDTPTAVGTWAFEYYVYYLSSITTTGVKLGVNYTGTVTTFVYNLTGVQTVTTASDGAMDQDHLATTGGIVVGWSARAKTTTAPMISAGADTNSGDMLFRISGLAIVTVAGNFELYHASETAASTTVKAGTSLVLTKTA